MTDRATDGPTVEHEGSYEVKLPIIHSLKKKGQIFISSPRNENFNEMRYDIGSQQPNHFYPPLILTLFCAASLYQTSYPPSLSHVICDTVTLEAWKYT